LSGAATAALLLPRLTCAQLVAGDSFPLGSNPSAGQYQSGVALKNQPAITTTGFVTGNYSGGSPTSNIVVDGTGCNYPWLGASSTTSGRVKWLGYSADHNTRSAARNLGTVPNSNVYYESMLVIESAVTNYAANVPSAVLGGFGNAALPLPGDTNSSSAMTGLYIGFSNDGVSSYNNNSGNMVIRYDTGNTDSSGNFIDADAIVMNGSTSTTTPIIHDNTYCVVTKITVPTGGVGLDTVNWWLNPTVGTSDATLNTSSAALGTFTGNIVSGSNPGSSFSRLSFITQGWYTGAYWDEPRLSTTLAGLGFVGASNLIWNNAGGTGDGYTWDTSTPNFNNGTAVVAYSDQLHDNVTFNDNNNYPANPYAYTIELQNATTGAAIINSPSSTTFNNSAGAYTLAGAGGIAGNGALTKLGTAAVYLTNTGGNSYTGGTNVAGGTLYLDVAGTLPTGTNLNIAAGASVIANGLGSGTALVIGGLGISGVLDVQKTGLDVTGSTLAAMTAYVQAGYNGGKWNGTSGAIISSTAAADTTHLTALGVILNDTGSGTTPLYGTGGTLASTFDGISPSDGDMLVKYTYYGDANLDGKVDGSDYTRIDNGFLSKLSGWYNGDFNYDGVVNGSDYTLIDNAFNTQGAQFSSEVASSTAEIAGASAVPEPAALGLISCSLAMLVRRKRS
jgi:hypothetical protein